MKALVIKVRGAGVFGDSRISGNSDFLFDNNTRLTGTRQPREKAPYLKIPKDRVGIPFVANLLRVLCGQRPVPTIRAARYTGDSLFKEIASKVRVTLDGGECSAPVRGDGEMMTTHKAIGGKVGTASFTTATTDYRLDGTWVSVKGGVIYWDRLKRFLGDALYLDFMSVVETLGGVGLTAQQAIEFLNTKKGSLAVNGLCSRLAAGNRKPMINIIQNENPKSFTIHSELTRPLNALPVCFGVAHINKFDCTLTVPVTEEQLGMFSKGTGVATFLEGGVASIDHVEEWSEILESNGELTVEGELCT